VDIQTSLGWSSPASLIGQWRTDAERFQLDRQDGQRRRLLIMVEAAGMKPQIDAVTTRFGVPVIPSGGFDSLTAKYELAQTLGNHDGTTEVLDIGDHDPSGTHRHTSLAEDVQALIDDLGLPGRVIFTGLAVTPEQITTLNLPTAPPKETDRRAFAGETVQAEAIPPDVLARIVTDAITARIDPKALKRVLAREQRCRDWLGQQLDHLDLEDAP
jgi:hypothetical protein